MATQPAPRPAVQHCYGVLLHHRLAWWLVEFPELDAAPVRARKLSGRLTPALADWLRSETGDAGLPAEVTALHPDSRCWSGEFSCVRAAGASICMTSTRIPGAAMPANSSFGWRAR
ncbi:hypothetical protein ACFSHP_18660 [Novosphingobium panipatense]